MNPFASRSLTRHLTRGLGAIFAFAMAFQAAVISPWLVLGAVLAGIVLLRGCPICWSIGLVETLTDRPAATERGDDATTPAGQRLL